MRRPIQKSSRPRHSWKLDSKINSMFLTPRVEHDGIQCNQSMHVYYANWQQLEFVRCT